MNRREQWQKIADAEAERWSATSLGELISELHEVQVYEVEVDSRRYQVEVEMLENTDAYIHVLVAVDDGSLPWSIKPSVSSFITRKD
jgi:hypothetical protein